MYTILLSVGWKSICVIAPFVTLLQVAKLSVERYSPSFAATNIKLAMRG